MFGQLISQYAPDELRDTFAYTIRVFIDDNNNLWFIGSEIASIMGYQNTRDALSKHVPEQYKMGSVANRDGTSGGNPNIVLISELGLYALAMRSKLPKAYEFQDWVYRVISKIRQYGGYISAHPFLKQVVDTIPKHLRPAFSNMRGRLSEQQKQIEEMTRKLDKMQHKADYFDLAMDSSKGVPMTVIAKDFGMSANELHSILMSMDIIYRLRDTWVLHKAYQDQGLSASKTRITDVDDKGELHENAEIITYWTEKGKYLVYNKLLVHGYKPIYVLNHLGNYQYHG